MLPSTSLPGATIVAAVTLAFSCASLPLLAADQVRSWDICVAVDGNDAWSGKLASANEQQTDGPLATLAAARDSVRRLRKERPDTDITVVIRGGEYRLSETLVFSLADSTNGQQRVIFEAFPGESPVITSAVPVRNWRPLTEPPAGVTSAATGKLWRADLPAGITRPLSLYQGRSRLPRARGTGFQPTRGLDERKDAADLVHFPSGTLDRLANSTDAELLVLPSVSYEMNVLRLASVDAGSLIARTAQLCSRPIGPVQFHPESIWGENALEWLDAPGEWVVDTRQGSLFLWPAGNEPGKDISIPALTELIRIERAINTDGPRDVPVQGIVLRGLTFSQGERRPWNGGTGTDLQHCWEHHDSPTALVRLRGAERCAVERCRLIDSSGAGIRLDLHCQQNSVVENEIGRLGGVGVLLAGYGPGSKDCNRRNEIANNWIHDVGEIYWGSPAIFVWQSGENHVAHNTICHTPYSGIVVSGRISLARGVNHASSGTVRWREMGNVDAQSPWKERQRILHGRDNLVEFNDISDVMRRMGDGNHVYVSGTGGGNTVRHNYLHDTDSDHMGEVIRCDDDQQDTLIEGNVIVRCRCMHEGIAIKGTNDIISNVIIGIVPSRLSIKPRSQLHAYIGLEVNPAHGAVIQRNVIYSLDNQYAAILADQTYGQGEPPRLEQASIDYNLYFCRKDLDWGQAQLVAGRALGLDRHSVSADPLFTDLASNSASFQPNSPVWKLGFEAIDLRQCGVRSSHPYASESAQP